jgi:type IV secretory pathway TraG/TraD family ATPase VirD4
LAAAFAGRPITQVYLWPTDPTDDGAVHLLQPHRFPLSAAAVKGIIDAPDKQRGGVYGTAQEVVSFLTNRAATTWVTEQPGDRRPHFDPAEFVRSAGTLYSLSKEGEGSTGPLVTALTVAVTEAAENLARISPGGRLPVPLVAVLDEAANVCRWHNLPDLYSHYGSRGITILTMLQSWSQGVDVWGRDGMRKLWSAATVRVYGGGVSVTEFLSELSQLIGQTDTDTVSTSRSRGTTTSRSLRRERILDVADLGAMPRGRAVLFASGAPPGLVRTLPWM